MDQPIILCGLGRVGWRVLEYLRTGQIPVVAVDNECQLDDSRLGGVPVIVGDCRRPEVLQKAGLATARAVLILTSDDLVNISTTLMVRHLHPEVRVVMRMFNQNLITRLGKAVNNTFALSTSTLAAPVMALAALTGQALGTFGIDGVADGQRQVAEVTVGPGHTLRGLSVAEAATQYEVLVLAHFPVNGPARTLLDVDDGAVLETGDRIVACAHPQGLARLLEAGETVYDGVLWSSGLPRLGRMLWRALAEIDLPVKLCTAVLVLVVLVGTLVFRFSMANLGIADGLYRTISLIATGADMRVGEGESAGLKVFVSFLRIFGMALTAAFTAIVTNYLLRARLGGALEVRRIPDGGHVIVCGLGNIGFRVVEELVRQDERVVVLELSRDSRFVTTARRLGVGVIHGDATVREVLRQTNAATARAVIACTSNDLVNLEIALLVRELNEQQRVVVRLSDPFLAQTLRDAAKVRLALSVPVLAAPAFVAALFGDRVQSVFLVGDRLLAVVDLMVQAHDDHLVGQTVRAVAVDYRLVPAAVVTPDGVLQRQMFSTRLTGGCRVLAIIGLSDLERLARRQAVPADCAVEVMAFTLPARQWVSLLLRTQRKLNPEDAERALEQLPVCVGDHLTRGQAEDLLELLERERVTGRLRQGMGAAL